jgi:hypothetical protein
VKGISLILTLLGAASFPALHAAPPSEPSPTTQYLLFNRAPGQGMYQGQPETLGRRQFEEILTTFPNRPGSTVQTGLSYVFSPFRTPPETTAEALQVFLTAAAETSTPIVVQVDLEHWWEARPDLWNWWDPHQPGHHLENRENVEWTGWSPEHAVQIAWRNWGRQIRVLPPPNLASPRYLAACRAEIRILVQAVLAWRSSLPEHQKHLLVGIKLGHETSIGVNAFHLPEGNSYAAKPADEDPIIRLDHSKLPARGVALLGHAALVTSGIRSSGQPTAAELAEVSRRYLEILCREAVEAGMPRDRLFAHGAGWAEGDPFYQVPLNPHACPAWSFYQHAADPGRDSDVTRHTTHSDAPFWAAAEWLLEGPHEYDRWHDALTRTLALHRCRFVCIFNWETIRNSPPVLQAIQKIAVTR